jgi:solute carrier family 35, member E3
VFTNKQIFKDAHLRKNQSTFAAFHFAITGITLYYASRRSLFEPQRAGLVPMMPLGLAMCMNVILPNLSLAYSSVAFYQIARVLLTPTVAVIHFVVYRVRLPKQAAYCLIPICLGVAMVSYYDTQPRQGLRGRPAETTPAGVVFALGGVLASSLYTVWIETYRKKFEMNSMQLLFNQAPISSFLLLYAIPFTDQTPDWTRVSLSKWVLILTVCRRCCCFVSEADEV